jgi:hypothetical protein
MPLSQALNLARQQLQAQVPPPGLQARVQARVQEQMRAAHGTGAAGGGPGAGVRANAHSGARWAWSGAAVCALLLVGSVLLMLGEPTSSGPAMASGGERMAGFMPLVPEEDWPTGDAPAWVVNTELRRDRLVALGLPFDPARAADSVRAELLVRPSGEVLAVRFLQ